MNVVQFLLFFAKESPIIVPTFFFNFLFWKESSIQVQGFKEFYFYFKKSISPILDFGFHISRLLILKFSKKKKKILYKFGSKLNPIILTHSKSKTNMSNL